MVYINFCILTININTKVYNNIRRIIMNQQLLVEELTPAVAGLIQESSTDGKNVWLNGIFMQAELKNRNGRVYPLHEISAAVQKANEAIKQGNGILGELDHPQNLTINLDRVSHLITEMRMEGSNVIGKAKLLDTPMGSIAKTLAQAGVALGVSSRGAGAVNESGGVSNFNFITVDIVAQPSAINAYPSTVYESLEHSKSGHNILSLAEQVQHDPAAQKYLKEEIMKWINTGLFAKR
jgi:hypothetical protein